MGIQRANNGHLVLVPCPLQGHMNPMLHLAKLLHSKGFLITIVVETHAFSSHLSDFCFESMDGLSNTLEGDFDGDVVSYLLKLNLKCKAPFLDCLTRLKLKNPQDPILCIIHDSVMYFSVDVSRELGIPRMVLRTSSAANFYGLSLLRQNGAGPIRGRNLVEPVKEIPFLRFKDMPVFNRSTQEATEKVFNSIEEGTKTASAVIWNSLSCLEESIFETIKGEIGAPIFPLGPLNRQSCAGVLGCSLLSEEQRCLTWLDRNIPNSVIYVSLGSLITITENELIEIAWGLANSGLPFLWVIRPGLVHGSNGVELLPKEFGKMTRNRSCIVSWAPQQEVLAHKATGGFLTHNGWNSTLESICAGVPMLCWPCVGDQKVNARLVSHSWRVGIQLEAKLGRRMIGKSIRRLMVHKEGREIRDRALQLKEKVELSLVDGGNSCELIKLLSLFKSLQQMQRVQKFHS